MTITTRRAPRGQRRSAAANLAARSAHETGQLAELRRRTRSLLATEIGFIPNASFRDADAEDAILDNRRAAAQVDDAETAPPAAPRGLPAHLARLCEAPLLSAHEEQTLFRRMNYLKYRANALRTTLDPHLPSAGKLDQIDALLASARAVRDRLVRANMRLVMSLAKKFVTPQVCFDELLSEGIATLLQAVEKFDFGRGFRFSTYAYRAIARGAYRAVTDRRRDQGRFASGAEDTLEHLEQPAGDRVKERLWQTMGDALGQMLQRLDRRERLVIRARYALGRHRRVRTFQSLADRLGVSKERVRQLEQRAVKKLRKLAGSQHMRDLIRPLQGI